MQYITKHSRDDTKLEHVFSKAARSTWFSKRKHVRVIVIIVVVITVYFLIFMDMLVFLIRNGSRSITVPLKTLTKLAELIQSSTCGDTNVRE